jgi:hypothetical protein
VELGTGGGIANSVVDVLLSSLSLYLSCDPNPFSGGHQHYQTGSYRKGDHVLVCEDQRHLFPSFAKKYSLFFLSLSFSFSLSLSIAVSDLSQRCPAA